MEEVLSFECEIEAMATVNERLGVLEERVANHIKFFWVAVAFLFTCLGAISLFLFHMNGRLGLLVEADLPQQLQITADQPSSPKNQEKARKLLATAKSSDTPIPAPIVEQAGKKFIDVAPEQQNAWNTALELVSYRTFLNINLDAVGTAQQIATTPVNPLLTTHYHVTVPAGYEYPNISVGGDVPASQAAEMHLLNEPSLNQGTPRGKEVILFQGGGLGIDGYLIRDAVIRNTVITYLGGPLKLENVIFVNCVFIMKNESPQRGLAYAILSQPATTFSV